MHRIVAIVLFGVVLLLFSCQNNLEETLGSDVLTPATQSIESTPQNLDSAYPAPGSDAGYPGSLSSIPIPSEPTLLDTGFESDMPVPTPSPGRATVTGYLVQKDENTPVVNFPVVLAQIFRNDQEEGAFVYDTATSPYALTDENGRFIFADVEPAEFVIVAGNIEVNQYVILSESSGKTRIINLLPSQLLELEPIEIDLEN